MKKLFGLFLSVALMGSGVALAGDEGKKKEQQTQSQSGAAGQDIGGSGQTGQMGMDPQLSGTQLTGRVVKSEKKMIYLEHAGAIVPLKIDKNTQFMDPAIKRPQDIKPGEEIRASFEVRKTDNVATSIQKAEGMGGSGKDVMSPDSSINQPPDTTLPPSGEGTGGSGNLDTDIPQDTGSEMDSDVNADQDSTSGDR
ncbi:MAG: hypothetical protein JXB05_26560 [Myxococcaceae bacterium]|nr:hypothetical protein [Myxococcaceae bacterium]